MPNSLLWAPLWPKAACFSFSKSASALRAGRETRLPPGTREGFLGFRVACSLFHRPESEVRETLRRAYPYRNFADDQFETLFRYLTSDYDGLEDKNVYAKIWRDENDPPDGEYHYPDFAVGEPLIGKRGKLARVIYMTNIGTIPDSFTVDVFTRANDEWVGNLDEDYLDTLEPEEAIRSLVHFTMDHFWNNPWFISMLNTENLLGGTTIRTLEDAADIQSVLLKRVRAILDKGKETGRFSRDITATDLYIMIASMCWFPISNMHTLRVVFESPIGPEWLNGHAERAANMVIGYLKDNRKSS